jgi:hypothetical protein
MGFREPVMSACGLRLVLAGVVMVTVSGLAAPTVAAQSPPPGPVSAIPASGTPALAPTGKTEQVRQLVQCGADMFAVGSFTSISQVGKTHAVHNTISFKATAPFTLTGWVPDVNGTVNSIAFSHGNCADAYLGGSFTSIDGTNAENIAEVSTSTGAVISSFLHDANGEVETMVGHDSHLIVGGVLHIGQRQQCRPLPPEPQHRDRPERQLHQAGHIRPQLQDQNSDLQRADKPQWHAGSRRG